MSKLYMPDLTTFSWQPPIKLSASAMPTASVGERFVVKTTAWGGVAIGNIAWCTASPSTFVEIDVPIGAMAYDISQSEFIYKSSTTEWSTQAASPFTPNNLVSDLNTVDTVTSGDILVGDSNDSMTPQTATYVRDTLLSAQPVSAFLTAISSIMAVEDIFLVGASIEGTMTTKTPANVMATLSGTNAETFNFGDEEIGHILKVSTASIAVGGGTTISKIEYNSDLKVLEFTYT